ncbi:MAG TPA: hypothetical protein VFG68_05030 [Fimbriiglobus sp.]|nr:hypothetical protein [Fimbriiglobus sp.]
MMAEVTLYYQERADGGRRSGLYVDGSPALGVFVEGGEESDPALLWYLDLVWETDTPPTSQEAARAWLADRADDIRAVLEQTADELEVGIDVDLIPWRREWQTGRGPVCIAVSAMRRFAAVDVGRRVRDLAARWGSLYPSLAPVG